jgi:hypothetical protein
LPDGLDDQIAVQFAKINLFRDRSLFSDRNFPGDSSSSSCDSWQSVVQLNEFDWIPSHVIVGLAFIFMEEEIVSSAFDDCRGMANFFVLKYRVDRNGGVSIIPRQHAFPPFPGRIESFCKIWSVDHCELIFNGIRQIRQDMQCMLCRVAQSQGEWAVKNAKLQLPGCSWFYIKNMMATRGIDSVPAIRYSQPHAILSWGLTYHSWPHTGYLDVLCFDMAEKLESFRAVFGKTAGYGVRKKRPKYSESQSLLSVNDVLNIVLCPSQADSDSDNGEHVNPSSCRFQCLGVTDDGIDLAYDSLEGTLQIVVRYSKLIVTNESLQCLSGVGVTGPTSAPAPAETIEMNDIVPGMEFMDSTYVMQIEEVLSTEIRARKVYKIHETTRTTTKVNATEVITYTNIADVYERIQQMLE